jgi:hypothetical protein
MTTSATCFVDKKPVPGDFFVACTSSRSEFAAIASVCRRRRCRSSCRAVRAVRSVAGVIVGRCGGGRPRRRATREFRSPTSVADWRRCRRHATVKVR